MSEMLLFSPLSIRGIELRNRIVVPPKQQNSVAGIQLGHSGRKARAKRPELADGCCLEIGHRGSVPERTPAIRLLAGYPRQARLRHSALDLAEWPQRYRKCVVKLLGL